MKIDLRLPQLGNSEKSKKNGQKRN